MNRNSVIFRDSDHKPFKVVDLGHWSTVLAEDGEEDHVKWYGGDSQKEFYVSANKGHGYVLLRPEAPK